MRDTRSERPHSGTAVSTRRTYPIVKLSRAIVPAALAGALLLTGCSGGANQDAAGEDCLPSGSASDSIEFSGEVGKDIKLTSKTPVKAEKLERTVITEGKGEKVKDGENIAVAMSMINGRTGDVLEQAPESSIPFTKDSLAGWAYDGLRCATSGEESALVATYKDVFGEQDPAQLPVEDLKTSDSFIIVMKFGEIGEAVQGQNSEPGTLSEDKLLKKAEGKAQKAPAGLPTVKLAENGEPTITIPKDATPPEKLEVATLIEGDGETVKEGDRVYVNYRGVIWSTGEEFDSSWSRGAPIDFLTTQVIGGFSKALVGQKVGSQVISVVPAEDGGYGAAGLEQMGHKPDDTMVFVLDILGTVHAK